MVPEVGRAVAMALLPKLSVLCCVNLWHLQHCAWCAAAAVHTAVTCSPMPSTDAAVFESRPDLLDHLAISMQGMSVVPPGATMASANALIETQMRTAVAARREYDRRQLAAHSRGAGRHSGQHKQHDAS